MSVIISLDEYKKKKCRAMTADPSPEQLDLMACLLRELLAKKKELTPVPASVSQTINN